MKTTWTITILAAILFVPLFVTRGIAWLDFWWWLAANLVLLLMLVASLDGDWREGVRGDLRARIPFKIGLGLLSAGVLFGVFYVGNILIRMIFEGSGEGIQNVYSFKQEAAPLRIGILMLLVIGPGEELFWRGYLQRKFTIRYGKLTGFILATTIYTVVHIATGNMVLVLAAFICGIFWGWLYMRYKSMIINVVSHTVWDIFVFLNYF